MIRILLALSKISGIADAFIKKNVSVFNSNNTDEIINYLVKINDKIIHNDKTAFDSSSYENSAKQTSVFETAEEKQELDSILESFS